MEYTQIGFTKKSHGVKGEIKVIIEEQYEDLFLSVERVFLEIKGSKQPFFIESIRGGGDLIVQFEDVPTKEEARLLQSKNILLPSNELPMPDAPPIETLEYGRINGYLIIDKTVGTIGLVKDVFELPQQEMALVQYQGRDVLIPLNEQFVQSVDDKKQQVLVDIPEGLLTL